MALSSTVMSSLRSRPATAVTRTGTPSKQRQRNPIAAVIHQGPGAVELAIVEPGAEVRRAAQLTRSPVSGPVFHLPDVAEDALCRQLQGVLHLRPPGEGPVDHQAHSALSRRGQHAVGPLQAGGHRLLDQDVQSAPAASSARRAPVALSLKT